MVKELSTIYIMWLRDMKRFIRSPSRIIGNLILPLLLLVSLGAGFGKAGIPGMGQGVTYFKFLVPGMVGMTILFSSVFSGFGVLWDRQYGFLKEIMVAPVSRVAIMLGRISSGATMGVLQSVMLVLLSGLLGFKLHSFIGLLAAIVMMVLVSISFTGLGLIFASRMKDDQGFGLIMNFMIMPVFFLSGAFAPISNLPAWVRGICYLNPLTYGVDSFRRLLLGSAALPLTRDFAVCLISAVIFILLGAFFFETSEVV
jgi:ABC-2 type transport system permease protein